MNKLMNDIDEIKAELRLRCINERKGIAPSQKRVLDRNIELELLCSDYFVSCENFLCYVSTPYEINTRGVIEEALKRGKRVYVPKCGLNKGEMSFFGIDSLSELAAGKYGVLEPAVTRPENMWVGGEDRSMCVVPALCADKDGFRLGYGGGYYDRFLRNFTGTSVCLCYPFLFGINIPTDEYDVKCDAVITGDQEKQKLP